MVSKFYKWLMASFVIVAFSASVPHPIYVSVTEIEHNNKDKTLEISCKIFTDDFEKTLRRQYNTRIDLLNPKEKAAMDKLVSGYVLKHLSVKADGKTLALQYLGYEQQEEGIVSFYQVNDIILFEYKKEQISIIHAKVNGNTKSTKLINPDEKASFEF